MRATQHPTSTRVLGAPQGWSQAELPCNAIAITDEVHQGIRMVSSYWKPSAEELAALNAGQLVRLVIVGATMPPVAIEVDGL